MRMSTAKGARAKETHESRRLVHPYTGSLSIGSAGDDINLAGLFSDELRLFPIFVYATYREHLIVNDEIDAR